MNKLKIGIGVIITSLILTAIFVYALVYGLQAVLGVSGGGIAASSDQAYLITATSSATARSNSYDIQGARRVTLFIGSAFDGLNTDEAVFTFEMSDIAEPAQGVSRYGTTTRVVLFSGATVGRIEFGTTSPFALAAATYGTTTASIELTNNGYSFLRVIRTTDTANRSTSTVSIIRTY